MPNIRDIANKTGYSVATVSRVLSNHPYVSDEKRKHILAVVEELNYIPNQTARALSLGKTQNIGVVIPFTNHTYYDRLISGIINEAFKHDYRVTLLPTNYSKEKEKQYMDEFAAKTFDGIILTTTANASAFYKSYLQHGPVIFCEKMNEPEYTCVFEDLEGAIISTFSVLSSKDVQSIGLTLGRSKHISNYSKMIINLTETFFPNFSRKNIFWECYSAHDAHEAAQFFSTLPLDAILTNGDDVAATIIQNFPSNQTLPLIIGREHLLISEILNFSTIETQLELCGKEAFKLFLSGDNVKKKIPYNFIARHHKTP
ncbi:LacI family DNA-binding transcriptional regulator [Vagococcus silagei]|uniref:LacI family DNA-binding transcriptional regulator n=1 Tax=Vagococcus silagei TaxID=2508885 RepID=A0A4S3B3H7_9ENTE|nr:LacI family DNA-binding transcriptional regulator [Vagococcus silagei]THB60998.1 LacI family DNA-binding transcriptional regulator [Vagococcus silagei]